MEKEIEVLKRIYKQLKFEDSEGRIAIVNLINRVKELEECLEAEEKYAEGLNRDIKSLLNIEPNNNFISKSKIKEKIEEIKKYRDLARECITESIIIVDSDSLNYGRKEAHNKDIEILQKLLEEES